MKGRFVLDVPGDVSATVCLTAPVKEWKELLQELKQLSGWPTSDVRSVLYEVIAAAEKQFYADGHGGTQ